MKIPNHCKGEQYIYMVIICHSLVVLKQLDSEIEKTYPRIHNAEEKESITTVQSKVISEYGNLANRGIFNNKTLQNLYTKVALIFSVWICQAIYESQVKTLASILMEWIDGQKELNQLKL